MKPSNEGKAPVTMQVLAPRQSTRLHRCDKHPEKVQYRELAEAFEAADRSTEKAGVRIHVYACDHCGYFHLSKKNGTENIGREVLRKDLALWTAAADEAKPEVVRDERWLSKGIVGQNNEAVLAALRAHSNPSPVKAVDVGAWAGISRNAATAALQRMGWVPTGHTRNRVWHRPGASVPEVETVDATVTPIKPGRPEPEWTTVDLNAVRDLTVDQLLRVYKSMGKFLELRVRER